MKGGVNRFLFQAGPFFGSFLAVGIRLQRLPFFGLAFLAREWTLCPGIAPGPLWILCRGTGGGWCGGYPFLQTSIQIYIKILTILTRVRAPAGFRQSYTVKVVLISWY